MKRIKSVKWRLEMDGYFLVRISDGSVLNGVILV